MAHYINAEQLKAELDKRYTEYRAKMKTDDFTYYEGMADALDHFEQYIDSLPEQLVDITFAGSGAMGTVPPKFKLDVKPAEVDLEKEYQEFCKDCPFPWSSQYVNREYIDELCLSVARHFAEWGARHSINWGDVQLLDTFILELSREEKDGTDWGDSEKFYTEVLRRFHEFNDKKISEIVAEWGAAHARKEG